MVPGGGLMFKGYDLNHSYEDCDVFVSLAKLKEHTHRRRDPDDEELLRYYALHDLWGWISGGRAGAAPRGRPWSLPLRNRLPSKSAPPPVDRSGSKEGGYRVPRVVADLVAARPVHLGIVDGIQTITGGEVRGRRHVEWSDPAC